MMNKDDERYESAIEGRRIGTGIIDTSDTKPSAQVIDVKSLSARPGAFDTSQLQPVKRKRKSPDKPWKKPPDMPKRPLSAYNIFFRDERERLLGAGLEGKQSGDTATTGEMRSGGGKKGKSKSGIGFANLAKTIANRWNELGDEIRAPYEAIAAAEKKKYDELVADWRVKQAAKKKALAAAKKESGEEQKASLRTSHNPYPSDRSLGSFSDTSNPYPTEWFHSGPEHEALERDDTTRTPVPPIVDTASGMSYDSRMPSGHGWQQHARQQQQQQLQDPSSYYQQYSMYDASGPVMRHSPDSDRTGAYGLPPEDIGRGSMSHDFSPAYRDFYHHSQQSMYGQQSSRRHNDMRMPRAASLPVSRQGELGIPSHYSSQRAMGEISEDLDQAYQDIDRNIAHYRTSRVRQIRPSYPMTQFRGSTAGYPRSSSMPYVQNNPNIGSASGGTRRRRIHPVDYMDPTMPPPPHHQYDDMHDDSYRTLPSSYGRSQPMTDMSQMHPRRHPQQQRQLQMNVGIGGMMGGGGGGGGVETGAGRFGGSNTTGATSGNVPGGEGTTAAAASGLPSLSTTMGTNPQQQQQQQRRPGSGMQQQQPSAAVVDEVLQNSLQNLNESLDEDAISFITSMKYQYS